MAQAAQTLSVRTECLTGSEIIDLAEQGEDSKEYAASIEHIVVCAQCRRLLKESRALLKVAKEAAPVAVPLRTKVKSLFNLPAWMTSLSVSQPLAAPPVFSFADTALLPTKLEFDNSRARGSYIPQDGGACVHIEHPDLEPGTLAYVAFLAETGEEKAGYFAVLQEDFCPSAEILVPVEHIAGSQVRLSKVDPFLLPDSSADALRRGREAAFAAAEDDEKRGRTEETWRAFARMMLKNTSPQSLAPPIRTAFEEWANQP